MPTEPTIYSCNGKTWTVPNGASHAQAWTAAMAEATR